MKAKLYKMGQVKDFTCRDKSNLDVKIEWNQVKKKSNFIIKILFTVFLIGGKMTVKVQKPMIIQRIEYANRSYILLVVYSNCSDINEETNIEGNQIRGRNNET